MVHRSRSSEQESSQLHRDYVFAPTHSIQSELCMILPDLLLLPAPSPVYVCLSSASRSCGPTDLTSWVSTGNSRLQGQVPTFMQSIMKLINKLKIVNQIVIPIKTNHSCQKYTLPVLGLAPTTTILAVLSMQSQTILHSVPPPPSSSSSWLLVQIKNDWRGYSI